MNPPNPNEAAPEGLLPCPFCGGEAHVFSEALCVSIRCKSCASGITKVLETSEEWTVVRDAWNRRAPASEPVSELRCNQCGGRPEDGVAQDGWECECGGTFRPAPLPPTGEGAKGALVAILDDTVASVLNAGRDPGRWTKRTSNESVEQWATRAIDIALSLGRYNLNAAASTHPALRAAEEALTKALPYCDGFNGKRIALEVSAALELIRVARKGGEGV